MRWGRDNLFINFADTFEALEVHMSEKFTSVRVDVRGCVVWLNVAKRRARSQLWCDWASRVS